jgi:hypothetical protein
MVVTTLSERRKSETMLFTATCVAMALGIMTLGPLTTYWQAIKTPLSCLRIDPATAAEATDHSPNP